MQKELEDSWGPMVQRKKDDETREEQHRNGDPGITLLEQTDPYTRCAVTGRDLNDDGRSNVWAGSYMRATKVLT